MSTTNEERYWLLERRRCRSLAADERWTVDHFVCCEVPAEGDAAVILGERGRPVVRVIERAERDCGIQEPPLSEVGWRGAERLILDCGCGERIVLVGCVAVRRWRSGRLVLECGCGESFVLGWPGARSSVGESRYSWLEIVSGG